MRRQTSSIWRRYGAVHLSLAHKGTDAVAIAAYGLSVGIDIETIQTRVRNFSGRCSIPKKIVLGEGMDLAEWTTRCWVAKEAYGNILVWSARGSKSIPY